ncbi:hypothetical protein FNH13_12775 [Ornithinimicrobium ciconiae]|uniref:PH domain-containing protein n=1 Tax=Ornithinimicrobium ciconiae TaxID=2594265 RepID=A0A516GCK0_9MICO|nr:hypothetical protein [Ornithinimicrobium ciconiae]QDO89090.1 hypothetical protein FNH13_12775 [Ornithinimicrobium ciconiae]
MPEPHPALGLPDEIVVRPDRARNQRRFLITGGALGLVAVACMVLAVVTDDPGYRIGAVIGGLLVVVLGGLSLKWQRDTYLDPEPALVLQRERFRVLHKGEHLWVPWTDVTDLSVLTRGAGLGRSEILRFDLRPELAGKLPQGKAPLMDRMFSWATNDLTYSRPADSPRFQEVAAAAMQLHDHATGGHRFRAAHQAASESGWGR